MIDLSILFAALYSGLMSGDSRYEVIDDIRIMDTALGIEYHLYHPSTGKPYKITKDENVILTGKQMTPAEASYLGKAAEVICNQVAEQNRAALYSLSQTPVNQVNGKMKGNGRQATQQGAS